MCESLHDWAEVHAPRQLSFDSESPSEIVRTDLYKLSKILGGNPEALTFHINASSLHHHHRPQIVNFNTHIPNYRCRILLAA